MMVTTYDDEDIERRAVGLRKKFRFTSDRIIAPQPGVTTVEEHNRRVAQIHRQENLKGSREAARTLFESMGAQYMPTVGKVAA